MLVLNDYLIVKLRNYFYVPHVIVTPTQILHQPMHPMKENCVLHNGRFCSSFEFSCVSLRDEDLVTMFHCFNFDSINQIIVIQLKQYEMG
ncbi:unnamed protein product [Rotaria sp. Silwood1]|nr:unnamed protein product [Rotaria sp. Silwood1]CAF4900419.1 unnamed protein product [Rotaria sp. Silwood1]